MISSNSRYAQSQVVTSTNIDGNDILAIVFSQPQVTNLSFTYHQVTATDFVDVLAAKYYNDPTRWWVIANANPEIVNWTSLTPGYLLRIPQVGTTLT